MGSNTAIAEIRERVTSLLDATSQEQIEYDLNKIHETFQKLNQITGRDAYIEYMAAVPTAKGSALGLNYAAQCLLDYNRTVKFLISIVAAIKKNSNRAQMRRSGYFMQVVGLMLRGSRWSLLFLKRKVSNFRS